VRASKACVLAMMNVEKWVDTRRMLIEVVNDLQTDYDVFLAAVRRHGSILQYQKDWGESGIPQHWLADRKMILAAVTNSGYSLQYASQDLKNDKEIVMAAAMSDPAALMFAGEAFKNDPDCLRSAGLWDDGLRYAHPQRVVLSIKYGQAATGTPYAADFAKKLKLDSYMKEFQTHNPNLWCKKFCRNEGCTGTPRTCEFPVEQNLSPATQKPSQTSCWRFSFRYHLQEAKDSDGFMLQVAESAGLGEGQQVETRMAQQVGMKVFRVCNDKEDEHGNVVTVADIRKVADAIRAWYQKPVERGGPNDHLENIWIGYGDGDKTQYERFQN